MLLLSQNCSTLPLIRSLYCWVLIKEVSSTIFKVFGMTRPGIERRSPRPLANTLSTRPKSRYIDRNTWSHISVCKLLVLDWNTWNYIIVYKILVFDGNTWNHSTVCKLSVLDRNIWNHITVCKLFGLDRNTWNHRAECKLLVLDRNTWKHKILCKLSLSYELNDTTTVPLQG